MNGTRGRSTTRRAEDRHAFEIVPVLAVLHRYTKHLASPDTVLGEVLAQ
jgi:hypothetical protein